jgi:hypothetical protein
VMTPGVSGGLTFTFPQEATWPDYWPPGWDGSLEYTVWAVAKVNGQWYAAGFVQMWRGRPSTGAAILTDFHKNWAYNSSWYPLNNYYPQVGDQMGFFISAGNARFTPTVTSVRERTNVVVVNLPAGDTGTFPFSYAPPPPPPPSTPQPFTDDPLTAGTEIKALHVTEFRTRIDAVRNRLGLSAYPWTNASLTPRVTPIRLIDFTEVRAALDTIYRALGRTPPTYTPWDGTSALKVLYVTETRTALQAVE